MKTQLRIRGRAGVVVGALALAGLLAGGAAYAATQITGPPGARPAGSTSAGHVSDTMMAGGGMGMGRFTRDTPFDAQFLDQMIVHHYGAIMSTQAMIADSSRPQLHALAREIITSQRAQLTQMKTWRAQWYPDLAPTFAPGGGMMSGSMMSGSAMGGSMMGVRSTDVGGMMGVRSTDVGGMMGGSMMGNGATGMMGGSMTGTQGTERMYLQMMIAHHQLAVDMAEQARTQATHHRLRDLAATIATEQADQIIQMRGYLTATPARSRG